MKKSNLIIGGIIVILIIVLGFFFFSKKSADIISGSYSVGDISVSALTEKDLSEEDWGRYQNAQELLAENAEDRASILNMGYMYRSAGKYQDSLQWFNHLVAQEQFEEADSDARYGVARVYTDQMLYESAEQEYFTVLEDYPLNIRMYDELLTLYREGNLEKNQKLLDRVGRAREVDTAGDYTEQLDRVVAEYNGI